MAAPILITGAAGFVGGHLLDLLVPAGGRIVGWHRPQEPPARIHRGVEWAAVELLDREVVARAIDELRPMQIYHLAGVPHVGQSWQYTLETYQGNVLGTHHLLDALNAADLRPRVLIAGSATIYQPQDRPLRETDPLSPGSPYATSKLAQEMLGRHAWNEDGLPALLARSFNHVGPGQHPSFVAPAVARQIALIENGRQEPVLTMGSLEPKRDLTDVRDTVRAYAAMMANGRPGQPYNVCSGRELSIATLVETFAMRARCTVRIVQDPARMRPNDPPLLVGDHSLLTNDTGWTPEIPFEQTVDDLLTYWRQRIRE